MKGKVVSVIVNAALCAVIACVCAVGFLGGRAAEVTVEGEGAYYRAEGGRGVSLMFNVYENTPNVYKILEVLEEYGARATFFLGGSWADDNVDCVRSIASKGHEVGSHGYFHRDHSKMTAEQNLEEIRPSVKLLNAILGGEIALFAPPSGAYTAATVSAASSLGLKTVMWSRDTIDWRDGDADIIVSRATRELQRGEFVLMHPKDATVAALPRILEYINTAGIPAITVSENIGE